VSLPKADIIPQVGFRDMGIMDFKVCWDYQESLLAEALAIKKANRDRSESEQVLPDNHLLFVEHPHVYTLGKSGSEENLLIDEIGLLKKDATFYRINRGGDITYHGPGQIVGYPILDLEQFFEDIHKYMRYLEEAIIITLMDYGIEAGRIDGLTGVWLDIDDPLKARKIAALGVKCSRWVTMHGFAFNVNTDLSYFQNIVPCGIDDKAVTSMEKELGARQDIEEVKQKLKLNLANVFDFDLV
jgi:lipoyl(octanoyl) transferase